MNLLQVLPEPPFVPRALCQRQTSIPEMHSSCDTQILTASFLCDAMKKGRRKKNSQIKAEPEALVDISIYSKPYLTPDRITFKASLYLSRFPLDMQTRLKPLKQAALLSISFTAVCPYLEIHGK